MHRAPCTTTPIPIPLIRHRLARQWLAHAYRLTNLPSDLLLDCSTLYSATPLQLVLAPRYPNVPVVLCCSTRHAQPHQRQPHRAACLHLTHRLTPQAMSPRVSLLVSLLLLLTVHIPLCLAKNTFRLNATAMASADAFTCPLGGDW
jgi:hypothetical protein